MRIIIIYFTQKSLKMEIRNKIKASGLKATPQRRAVYEVMQELGHCSIDEVIARVRALNPDITVSTIYRIMDSFCQVGLLSRFIGVTGKTIFDITPEEHHHIFTAQNTIVDIEDKQLTEMIRQRLLAEIPANEEIGQISIHIVTKSKNSSNEKENINI